MPVLLCTSIFVFAQTPEDEVMKPIDYLFDGMKLGDSSMVHQAFKDDVKMVSSFTNKKGEQVIKEEMLQDFLNAIGGKVKGSDDWNEKLYNTEIKIDGNIAQVWTEYSFFVGEKFSHCGVDAFQLVKVSDEWKIVHIMDTRRKNECKDFKDN